MKLLSGYNYWTTSIESCVTLMVFKTLVCTNILEEYEQWKKSFSFFDCFLNLYFSGFNVFLLFAESGHYYHNTINCSSSGGGCSIIVIICQRGVYKHLASLSVFSPKKMSVHFKPSLFVSFCALQLLNESINQSNQSINKSIKTANLLEKIKSFNIL